MFGKEEKEKKKKKKKLKGQNGYPQKERFFFVKKKKKISCKIQKHRKRSMWSPHCSSKKVTKWSQSMPNLTIFTSLKKMSVSSTVLHDTLPTLQPLARFPLLFSPYGHHYQSYKIERLRFWGDFEILYPQRLLDLWIICLDWHGSAILNKLDDLIHPIGLSERGAACFLYFTTPSL